MGLASFAALLNTRLYKLSLIQRRLLRLWRAGWHALDTALQAHLAPRAAKYRASIPQQFLSIFDKPKRRIQRLVFRDGAQMYPIAASPDELCRHQRSFSAAKACPGVIDRSHREGPRAYRLSRQSGKRDERQRGTVFGAKQQTPNTRCSARLNVPKYKIRFWSLWHPARLVILRQTFVPHCQPQRRSPVRSRSESRDRGLMQILSIRWRLVLILARIPSRRP